MEVSLLVLRHAFGEDEGDVERSTPAASLSPSSPTASTPPQGTHLSWPLPHGCICLHTVQWSIEDQRSMPPIPEVISSLRIGQQNPASIKGVQPAGMLGAASAQISDDMRQVAVGGSSGALPGRQLTEEACGRC